MFNFEKSKLLVQAEKLANYFTRIPELKMVCLSGSLARVAERQEAHDIDLVLLHDGTLTDRRFAFCNRELSFTAWYDGQSSLVDANALTDIFHSNAAPLVNYMERYLTCRADIMIVDHKVLGSCAYLNEISRDPTLEFDRDFFRRIFCEIPLLSYDSQSGSFREEGIKHGDSCCLPKRRWEDVRVERKAAQARNLTAVYQQ